MSIQELLVCRLFAGAQNSQATSHGRIRAAESTWTMSKDTTHLSAATHISHLALLGAAPWGAQHEVKVVSEPALQRSVLTALWM